jgi:hypothetical protein
VQLQWLLACARSVQDLGCSCVQQASAHSSALFPCFVSLSSADCIIVAFVCFLECPRQLFAPSAGFAGNPTLLLARGGHQQRGCLCLCKHSGCISSCCIVQHELSCVV